MSEYEDRNEEHDEGEDEPEEGEEQDEEEDQKSRGSSDGSEWRLPYGPHAGLTSAESLRLEQDVRSGVDSLLLDEEISCGEYVGLTRREAYARKHEDEGVFPELAVREEMELKSKFYGERQRGPNGEWLRDAKGALLPVIGIDRTLPIFDSLVPSGMWRGHTRRDVLMEMEADADDEGIAALRPIVEREIASSSEYTQKAVNEVIDTYLCIVFVNAVKYDGEHGPWERAENELDVQRVQNSLINKLLARRITLEEATKRMEKLGRDFTARLAAINVEEAAVRETALDTAVDVVRRKAEPAPMPLGGEQSTRGEIKETLIRFYEKGGRPKDAWRPGDLFVYGVDKSNSYRVYRGWLAKQRGE